MHLAKESALEFFGCELISSTATKHRLFLSGSVSKVEGGMSRQILLDKIGRLPMYVDTLVQGHFKFK